MILVRWTGRLQELRNGCLSGKSNETTPDFFAHGLAQPRTWSFIRNVSARELRAPAAVVNPWVGARRRRCMPNLDRLTTTLRETNWEFLSTYARYFVPRKRAKARHSVISML